MERHRLSMYITKEKGFFLYTICKKKKKNIHIPILPSEEYLCGHKMWSFRDTPLSEVLETHTQQKLLDSYWIKTDSRLRQWPNCIKLRNLRKRLAMPSRNRGLMAQNRGINLFSHTDMWCTTELSFRVFNIEPRIIFNSKFPPQNIELHFVVQYYWQHLKLTSDIG